MDCIVDELRGFRRDGVCEVVVRCFYTDPGEIVHQHVRIVVAATTRQYSIETIETSAVWRRVPRHIWMPSFR